ncbi:MAG: head-tail connector protein, partial [Pseudomonadota bacterium]
TWRYYISNPRHAARINRYPVIGITDAIGYDTSGNASALSASDITLDHRTRPADLSVNADVSSQAANGLDVDIEFGFGDLGVDVPEPIKRAILVLVAHWYAFRAEVMPSQQPVSLPAQYDRLIAPYRHRGLCA